MTSCCENCKPVIAMVTINLAFAIVNLLLKKVLDEGMNNLVIVTYRQTVATIFLIPIAYFLERKSRPKLTARILWYLFCSALVGATLTQYLFLIGLRYTSATFSCAFINMVPVCTYMLSVLFGLEKVNMKSLYGRAKVLGTMVCIGGAMLLTIYKGVAITAPHHVSHNMSSIDHKSEDQISGNKTERWVVGSLCALSGCILWSSWFILQARIGKTYPCQYSSTALLSFFSAIQSAILTMITKRNLGMWVLRGKLQIISVTYSGMVGSGLCYAGMSWCVKKRGPVFTAAFSPVMQIFVAMFEVSVMHQPIYLGSILGSLLVIAGLYILLWGKSEEAKDCATKQTQLLGILQLQQGEDCVAVSVPVIPITTK